MEDELIKKIQNLEVRPSKQANEVFQKKLTQIQVKRNNKVWQIAASVFLVGVSSFIFFVQNESFTKMESHNEDNEQITHKLNKPVIENESNLKIVTNIADNRNAFIKNKELKIAEINEEIEQIREEQETQRKIQLEGIQKITQRSQVEVNVTKSKMVMNIAALDRIYVTKVNAKDEELKKGDLIMQELMILKYGEILDEKATVAKLFTKEDNFLANEANEFKSRVMWVKNKLNKE
ncbi:MAG: hypothetical protein ACK4UP_00425 [Spirosomataceae bacterium]